MTGFSHRTLLLLVAVLAAALVSPTVSSGVRGTDVRTVGFGKVKIAKAGKGLTVTYAARRAGSVIFLLSRDRKAGRGDLALGKRRVRAGKGKAALRVPRAARLGAYRVLACASKRARCRASGTLLPVTALPRPLRVSPRLATGSAVSQDVGREGGSVSATGPDGTGFKLDIPEGALLDPTTVTLTPVQAVRRLPLRDGRMAGAVQVGPSGTRLLKPATLTIAPRRRFKRSLLTGFAFGAAGRQFHLAPVKRAGTAATLKVLEFKGYGAGQAKPAARYKLSRTRLPTAALNQLQQVAAVPRAPRGVRRAQASPTDELSTVVFNAYLNVRSLLPGQIDVAFFQYATWDAIASGLPGYPQVAAWREDLRQAFRAALELQLAEARIQCLVSKDTAAIARSMRYRTLVLARPDLRLIDILGKVDDLLGRCLRFELDYSVDIDGANGYEEAVKAGVKTTVPIRMAAPGVLSSFTGDAPLEVTNYSTGPVGCYTHTWEVTPANRFVVAPMKVDIHYGLGMERLPPTIEVTFDPGSLDEQVTHHCDGGSYTDQQHAYDGVTAALLGGEPGQKFTLRWTGGSGGAYASQTFTRSGAGADGGSYTGNLTFSLRHTPGG